MVLHKTKHPSAAPGPIEPLVDIPKAAFLLGISVHTLRAWIKNRKIEHVKVGKRVMIRPETIRGFVSMNTRHAVHS